MDQYVIRTTKIDGYNRKVVIYPALSIPNGYLVHWGGYDIGMIKKVDKKWYTTSRSLAGVVDKIGLYIDRKRSRPRMAVL